MQQNITLKLDKSLLQQAKIQASQQRTSVSALMVEALRSLLKRSQGYDKAYKKALTYLKKGFKMGGAPYFSSRDELHQRHG